MSGAATSAAKGLVKRGAFILFEGCDRSGKSTQVAKLVQRLQADGSKVEAMRFPDRTTEIGKMIDAYLRCATHLDDRAVHLLFSANRWECRERILALLEQGTSIVCDRYTFSGVAFSASKVGMDVEWCKAPDEGLPAPDVVFFLDLAVEDAMKRGQFGEERYEKEAMQRRVRENFHTLLKGNEACRLIDARQSIEEMHESLYAQAKELIHRFTNTEGAPPVKALWGSPDNNESNEQKSPGIDGHDSGAAAAAAAAAAASADGNTASGQ